MPNSFNCTNGTRYLLRDIFNMTLLVYILNLSWTGEGDRQLSVFKRHRCRGRTRTDATSLGSSFFPNTTAAITTLRGRTRDGA